MKTLIVIIIAGIVLSLTACGSIQINMKDGTARIEQCPGVTFRIIVIQGPFQPSARAMSSGGVVNFKSSSFENIDFQRSVTVKVFADTIPPQSECPIRSGVTYVLRNQILPTAPGTSDTYEIDLSDFREE